MEKMIYLTNHKDPVHEWNVYEDQKDNLIRLKLSMSIHIDIVLVQKRVFA